MRSKDGVDTTSAEFFEHKYLAEPDPWKFATSDYEQFRYDTILRLLENARYSHAFEPGCSIGELTVRLAPLCDHLTASDISTTASRRARQRCLKFPHVTVVSGALPDFVPVNALDLVALSEVGYYFDGEQLRSVGNALVQQLNEGGTLIASHWLGSSPDHKLHGDDVHEVLQALPGLSLAASERYEGFRIDKWIKA
jgi:SAM-dependent methyltransferase